MEFLSVLGIWTLAVLMPGPDLFLVIRYSTQKSKIHALSAVGGILVGTLVWLVVGFFLVDLLRKSIFFELLQFVGGGYLVYMAVRIFLSLRKNSVENEDTSKLYSSPIKGLMAGIFTNLSNPKPPIFISVILSKFSTIPPLDVALLLLIVMTAIPCFWFYCVVHFFTIKKIFQTFLHYRKHLDCVAGAIFFLFGINLITEAFPQLF